MNNRRFFNRMANGDLETYRCPAKTLRCAAKEINFNYMQVLEHALYHILFQIFLNEKEAFKNKTNELMSEKELEAGPSGLKIEEMTSDLVICLFKFQLELFSEVVLGY